MFLLEKLEMITLVCGLAAGIAAAAVLIKFNLHMFQLNGYKNGEHLHWIKKNRRQFRILIPDGALALAAALFLWIWRRRAVRFSVVWFTSRITNRFNT